MNGESDALRQVAEGSGGVSVRPFRAVRSTARLLPPLDPPPVALPQRRSFVVTPCRVPGRVEAAAAIGDPVRSTLPAAAVARQRKPWSLGAGLALPASSPATRANPDARGSDESRRTPQKVQRPARKSTRRRRRRRILRRRRRRGRRRVRCQRRCLRSRRKLIPAGGVRRDATGGRG